jgi:hypothetical protein
MEMTRNLPMYEEVVTGSPGLGHMQRAALEQDDGTDQDIVNRIIKAVGMGYLSPEAGKQLIDNIMGDQDQITNSLRGMPGPAKFPNQGNVFPYGSTRQGAGKMNGLLGDELRDDQ